MKTNQPDPILTPTTGISKTSEIDPDLQDLAEHKSEEDPEFEPLKPGGKRRTRRKLLSGDKKEVVEKLQAFFDEKALGYLLKFPFDYLARVHKNESLKLTPEESKTLTELTNKVIAKRMPEFLAKFSDEIALSIAATSIVIPRILLIKEAKKIQIKIKNTSASPGAPEV